jgi:hypothetical protein
MHKSVNARVGSEDAHEQGTVPSSRRFMEPDTTVQGHSRSAHTSTGPADAKGGSALSGRGGDGLWGSAKSLTRRVLLDMQSDDRDPRRRVRDVDPRGDKPGRQGQAGAKSNREIWEDLPRYGRAICHGCNLEESRIQQVKI